MPNAPIPAVIPDKLPPRAQHPRDRAQFRQVDHVAASGSSHRSPLDVVELGMRAAEYLRGWPETRAHVHETGDDPQ